jgi:hypothetical protein
MMMSKKYKGIKHVKRFYVCICWRMDMNRGVVFLMPDRKEYRCEITNGFNRRKGLKHRR